MPSASEFSTTPAGNGTIGGTNVGEGCPPGGLNDALRYMAAAARDSYDRIPAPGAFMPTAGGAFTGDIMRQSRGAYLHHANAAQTSGRVYFLPEGTALPALSEGDVVFFYS